MAELSGVERIHLIGVGGAGMSGLAKLLAALGFEVSGSDLKSSETLAGLADLGVRAWSGSRPDLVENVDLVVASSAVPEHDPEYAAAEKLGVEVWRRPRLLEALTARHPAIGVTGTHGKTSGTALLVAALRSAGRDPSFLVGGELVDLRTNAHLGDQELFVLEADEAFGTFESLQLRGLVVTNIEADHLDHYGSLDRLEDAFADVVRRVEGPVVIGRDDPGARRLAERTGRPTYGTDPRADWQISAVTHGEWSVGFVLRGLDGRETPVTIGRPGLHTVRNAAGVLALLSELGVDVAAAAAGLASFAGVKRRYEVRGRVAGVTVIDDYAHHPTEVATTLQAARRGGWRRIWVVFQPHLYSRTAELHGEFGAALAGADRVVVTDVYGSRESPQPGVTGELVADAARAWTDALVSYIPHRADIAEVLAGQLEAGDLVLTLGAGDITVLPDELLTVLASREADR